MRISTRRLTQETKAPKVAGGGRGCGTSCTAACRTNRLVSASFLCPVPHLLHRRVQLAAADDARAAAVHRRDQLPRPPRRCAVTRTRHGHERRLGKLALWPTCPYLHPVPDPAIIFSNSESRLRVRDSDSRAPAVRWRRQLSTPSL